MTIDQILRLITAVSTVAALVMKVRARAHPEDKGAVKENSDHTDVSAISLA